MMPLERRYFRAVIFYDLMKGLSASQSFVQLNDLFNDQSPCSATVFNWFTRFIEEGGICLMKNALKRSRSSGKPIIATFLSECTHLHYSSSRRGNCNCSLFKIGLFFIQDSKLSRIFGTMIMRGHTNHPYSRSFCRKRDSHTSSPTLFSRFSPMQP